MAASAAIPQFQLTIRVSLETVLRRRAAVPAERRPGVTAYLIQAAAEALVAHPRLNSTYEDNEVRQHHAVNIGVAVATEDGLAVPVIHHAPGLSADEIHVRLQGLRHRAGLHELRLEDVRGGTFTLSNLGPDILQFAALVNPPQTAILAVGTIHPDSTGHPRCFLTLSCDHRALDGADGAAFLRTLRAHLEQPDGA
jgi:pyruvate dehydrogenase E2 component (dihydrolipoamide acetyltransferase)